MRKQSPSWIRSSWLYSGLTMVLVGASVAVADSRASEALKENPLTIIDFESDDPSRWFPVNDGVMGGLSQSWFRRTSEATGEFAGVLSLENNGGFASIGTDLGEFDLSAHPGLEIRVRGDGRVYQLRVRTDNRFDGAAYRANFQTLDGEWTTVTILFEEFLPTFRGRILRNAPPSG